MEEFLKHFLEETLEELMKELQKITKCGRIVGRNCKLVTESILAEVSGKVFRTNTGGLNRRISF